MESYPSRRAFLAFSSLGTGMAVSGSAGGSEGSVGTGSRMNYSPAPGYAISGPGTHKRIILDLWGRHTRVPVLAQMSDGSLMATFASVNWVWEENGKTYTVEERAGKWNRVVATQWATRSIDGGRNWEQPVKTPYEGRPLGPWDALGGDEFLGVGRFSCEKDNIKLRDGSNAPAAIKLLRIRYVQGRFQFSEPVIIPPLSIPAAGPPAITRTLDGELAVICSAWPLTRSLTSPGLRDWSDLLGPSYIALRKSKDNGYTWGDEIIVDPIECGSKTGYKSYHVLLQLPDGALTTFWTEVRPQTYMRKSYDGGKTWTQRMALNPFRNPATGRPYSYQKLIHAVTLGEWGSHWYTDIVCEGRAGDRLLDGVPGGLVTAHSYDGGYTWEETQILDGNEWPPQGTVLRELLRIKVHDQMLGYGSIVRTQDKVLVASSGNDLENLRQKCFLYEVPGLVTPAAKLPPGATDAETPARFGEDAGGGKTRERQKP